MKIRLRRDCILPAAATIVLYLSDDAELIVNNDYFRAGNPKTPADEFRTLLTSESPKSGLG